MKFDLTFLEDVGRDVRYAARTLLRTPGFAVGVISLALTIGATTAVYSTVDWLLNRSPGGVFEPERLATLEYTYRDRPDFGTFGIAFRAYRELREVQDGFVDIAAYGKLSGSISDDLGADQVVFEYVTGSYFPVLGVRPHLGRTFRPEDDVEGVAPVAMLSYEFWQSRFGGDPEVLDRSIRLNGHSSRVVGVLPKEFEGYNLDWNGPTSVWVPLHAALQLGPAALLTRNVSFLRVIGRLRPEMTPELLQLKAPVWLQMLPPSEYREVTELVVTPGREMRIVHRGEATAFLGTLLTVCMLMLLAACSNIANFSLGRALARRREIAVRVALGAGRPRLLRQLLTEAMLLGGSAAVLGVGIGVAVAHLLAPLPYTYLGLNTRTTALTTSGAVGGQMLGAAAGLGLGLALAFGLLPALFSVFRGPVTALKNPKPHWTWGGLRLTTRQGVLVVQVAFSVVLAVTAGLYAELRERGVGRRRIWRPGISVARQGRDGRCPSGGARCLLPRSPRRPRRDARGRVGHHRRRASFHDGNRNLQRTRSRRQNGSCRFFRRGPEVVRDAGDSVVGGARVCRRRERTSRRPRNQQHLGGDTLAEPRRGGAGGAAR